MSTKREQAIEKNWTDIAAEQLVGRTVKAVRYMHKEEMEELGWYSRPIVIEFDNGLCIFPMADDEGNNAGALATTDAKQPTIPVL